MSVSTLIIAVILYVKYWYSKMYFQEYHAPGLSAEVCNAWQEAADMFDKAGAKVTQVSLPYTEYSINCYVVLNCCEVASNMARYDGIEFG